MDWEVKEVEVADDWECRWAWWEVKLRSFSLEEEFEGEEQEDKGEGYVEQEVFHG